MKDYYKILGVSPDATQEEIRLAFRTLARHHHPDLRGGDEETFKEVNEAHQVLSAPSARNAYDQLRRRKKKLVIVTGANASVFVERIFIMPKSRAVEFQFLIVFSGSGLRVQSVRFLSEEWAEVVMTGSERSFELFGHIIEPFLQDR